MTLGTVKKVLLFLIGLRPKDNKVKPQDYSPQVSVVIPAYNEEETIGETLQSLREQSYPVQEIIVVDDCSTDRTGEIARNFGAKVVRTQKNTGMKARAINFGLKFCSPESEIVIILDADTIISPNFVAQYVEAFSDPKVFLVSGYVLSKETKTIWQKARSLAYFYYFGLVKDAQTFWFSPIVASGCCLGIRRKILEELGGFSERYVAEDMALTWRGLIEGYKAVFLKKAVCWTKDPLNFTQYRRQITRWYRGFFQCFQENWKTLLLKNKRLGFFAYWAALGAVLNLVFWIWVLVAIITHSPIIWSFAILEWIVTTLIILKESLKFGKFYQALTSFIWYWPISFVDMLYFSKAFFQEIILRKHLEIWEKGH